MRIDSLNYNTLRPKQIDQHIACNIFASSWVNVCGFYLKFYKKMFPVGVINGLSNGVVPVLKQEQTSLLQLFKIIIVNNDFPCLIHGIKI